VVLTACDLLVVLVGRGGGRAVFWRREGDGYGCAEEFKGTALGRRRDGKAVVERLAGATGLSRWYGYVAAVQCRLGVDAGRLRARSSARAPSGLTPRCFTVRIALTDLSTIQIHIGA
jgi:hypothetical protein